MYSSQATFVSFGGTPRGRHRRRRRRPGEGGGEQEVDLCARVNGRRRRRPSRTRGGRSTCCRSRSS